MGGDPLFAADALRFGVAYVVRWQRLVHVAYCERANNNIIFRTLCGEIFSVGTTPEESVPTCLTCITEDER